MFNFGYVVHILGGYIVFGQCLDIIWILNIMVGLTFLNWWLLNILYGCWLFLANELYCYLCMLFVDFFLIPFSW